MRTLKLTALALMLTLTGIVYAAGAMQNPGTQDTNAKAEKNCCMMHGAAKTEGHAQMKREGEGCCGGGGGCCANGSCTKDHKNHSASMQKTAATDGEAKSCCGESSCCCANGSCSKEQKAGAHASMAAHEGAGCCKAHKSEAMKTAAASAEEGRSCCGDACACCGKQKTQAAQSGGR